MPVVNSTPPPSAGSKKSTPRPSKKPVREERREALEGLGQLAQVPLIAARQLADAATIGVHWPNVAREIAALADSQEAVARVIDPLIKVGPYTGLITAVLPMVMQFAVNHGRAPAGAVGTVPASSLSAQMEASLAQAEMESLKVQLEAERQARLLREEIAKARKDMEEAATLA